MNHLARPLLPSPEVNRTQAGRYRGDVDGLRAVAISAVLLFHYGFAAVSGGFVGVDVFFVISGYLITTIIRSEIEHGAFSLARFYERRVRRIVPALAAMLLVCGCAFFFVFLPEDMRLLAKSEVTGALFSTNILFETVANNYFDADNLTLQPLLHTWSLAVEAQFYLLYPLLLLPMRGRAGRSAAIVAVATAVSFGLCLRGTAHHPIAAFYLLPGRAWELSLGGLLAFAVRGGGRRGGGGGSRLAGVSTATGLAAILVAILGFDTSTPFPGLAALLPCAGAALVIAGGCRANPVSAWLGAAPLAWLGRISYSLYLWHWPVLVLARYGARGALPLDTRLATLAASLLLASLSYVLVERPFIARAVLPGGRGLSAAAAAAVVAVASLGGLLELTGRGVLPFARLPPVVLGLANGHFDRSEGDCDLPDDGVPPVPACRFGAPGAPPTIAVWGNSYARMWTPALDEDARRHGVAGLQMLLGKCPPLLGLRVPSRPACAGFNRAVLGYLLDHRDIRTVMLGADWFTHSGDLDRLADTLDALTAAGISVVVLLAPPQAEFNVPRTLALAALRREAPPPPIDRAYARDVQRDSTDVIARLQARFGFTTIDPASALCDATTCPLERDGHPVFYDAGHVTASAARAAPSLFDPLFDAAAAAPPRPGSHSAAR